MVRVKKSWCYKKEKLLVLQLTLSADGHGRSKVYLCIDFSRRPCVLKFTSKNEYQGSDFDSSWNSVIRPLLSEQVLKDLKTDTTSRDSFLEFANGWGILIEEKQPPVVHIVSLSEAKDLYRISTQGIYTKPWQVSEETKTRVTESFKSIDIDEWLLKQKVSDMQTESKTHSAPPVSTQSPESPTTIAQNPVPARVHKNLRKNIKSAERDLARVLETLDNESTLKLFNSHRDLVEKSEKSFSLTIGKDHFSLDFGDTADFSKFMDIQYKRVKRARRSREQLEDRILKLRSLEKNLHQAAIDNDYSSPEIVELLSTGESRRSVARANTDRLSEKKSSDRKSDDDLSLASIYEVGDVAQILVGKNASSSDLLIKKASSDTLWFHVTEGKGAHVLLKFRKRRVSIAGRENAIRIAHILAVHHSDWQKTRAAEIYSGVRSNLKKPRGGAVGLWIPQNCQRLVVRYTDDELKLVLATKWGHTK